MNGVVPIVKRTMQSGTLKHDFPSVTDQILGKYVDINTQTEEYLSIMRSKETEQTGIFVGAVAKRPATFQFDDKATEAQKRDDQFFFRYRSRPEDGFSCSVESGNGHDDGLVMFQIVDGHWHAVISDLSIFDSIREDTGSSSSTSFSSSSTPSSSSATPTSSSVPPTPSSSSVKPTPSTSSHSESSSCIASVHFFAMLILVMVCFI